jgi:molecular chaperone DnaK
VEVDGQVRPVVHAGGATTIPSVVAFPPPTVGGGLPLVGDAGLAFASRSPERVVTAVKRLLGRKFDTPEVKHQRQEVPYELVAARNGDVRVRVGRRHHPPPDVAAYVLGALKRAAEVAAGDTITETVIAVPSDFDDLQRQAMCDAARIAGLDVRGLVTEPSAAVFASGLFPAARGEERKVVVYDLGGGSFDVAALVVRDDEIEVVANGGDGFLGGEDFDQNLLIYVCDELVQLGVADPRNDRALMARLRIECEGVKRRLSTEDRVELRLPERPGGVRLPVIPIERERLESVTQVLLDQTLWPCEGVLRDAGWSSDELDAVLLVGGQTRAPRVRAQVAEFFGRPPLVTDAPEILVAMGAARQALALSTVAGAVGRGRGKVRNPVIETTCQSIGVETAGGVYTRLIPRGTRLPAQKTQVVSTSMDGQTQIVLHLLQGEREMAVDNVSIAHVQIGPLPARARGVVQIEVEIATSGKGLPEITAKDATTEDVKPARLRPSGGLSESEMVALTVLHAGGASPTAAAVLGAENALASVNAGGVDDGAGTGEGGLGFGPVPGQQSSADGVEGHGEEAAAAGLVDGEGYRTAQTDGRVLGR